MGYTISTLASSQKLRRKMHAFMLANYRPWSKIIGHGSDFTRYPEELGDLSYNHHPRAIGFDYNDACWACDYVYALTRWMAIQIGEKKTLFSKEQVNPSALQKPVPFVWYDHDACWPVLVGTGADARKLPKTLQWCTVDKYGIKNGFGWAGHYRSAAGGDLSPGNDDDFLKAQAALGDPPMKSGPERDKWIARHSILLTKAYMPAIKVGVKRIRDEIKRLDKLWREG